MNCLFLVLLLLSCGNDGGRRGFGTCNTRERDCDRDRRDGRGRDGDRNDGRGRGGDRDDRDGCGCRNDDRQESRMDSRSFIPYPGSSCQSNESMNNGGCNCAD